MDEQSQLAEIRRKVRQRFLFSGFTILFYASFVLCYTDFGAFLAKPLGDSYITGGLILFVTIIVTFLVQEFFFLHLNRPKQ